MRDTHECIDLNNILLTNVNGSGDDVLVYTRLDAETLAAAYRDTGITFDECYAIKDEDVQYYLFEPCWLTAAEESRALELSSAPPRLCGSIPD